VRDTNICETTLLATDYLNHVNEIIMLIEMIPDNAGDARRGQGLAAQDLCRALRRIETAIRRSRSSSTRTCRRGFRTPFEHTISQLDDVIARALRLADERSPKNNPRMLRDRIGIVLEPMRRLVDVAAASSTAPRKC